MKTLLLITTCIAFLASPMVQLPAAQAGTPASSLSGAGSAKASAAKAQQRSQATAKTKARAKAKAKTKKRVKARQTQRATARVETPLRRAAAHNPDADAGLGLQSAAALVIDQRTGEALYAKNADIPTAIASITKLMTAMVVLDAGLSMEDEITITMDDVDRLKGTGSRLAVGNTLTRGELMHLSLIASENRAAAALTRAYPGGREAFIAAMNRKARSLGMEHTRFVDGTGLSSENKATAEDLARLVDAAYRYAAIREISTARGYDVILPGTRTVQVREDGRVKRVTREVIRHLAFTNTNALTRTGDWDIGVSKTGFINEAGRCLVMQARISDTPVIIVLLDSWGSWGRVGDAQRIRKWLEGQSIASRVQANAG